jgi:hypothetical protein
MARILERGYIFAVAEFSESYLTIEEPCLSLVVAIRKTRLGYGGCDEPLHRY